MIEDKILENYEEQLKNRLANLIANLEIEKVKLEKELETEKNKIIKDFEKEETLRNEANLRALKNRLEKELNERKREFLEQQIERILEVLKENYKDELINMIKSIEYDEIIVPPYIKINNAKTDNKLKYGFIFKPKGKNYYINMDMRRIIEKYLDKLLKQI